MQNISSLDVFEKKDRPYDELRQKLIKSITDIDSHLQELNYRPDIPFLSSEDAIEVTYFSAQLKAFETILNYIDEPLESMVVAITSTIDIEDEVDNIIEELRKYGHIPIKPSEGFFKNPGELSESQKNDVIYNQRKYIDKADCLLVINRDSNDKGSNEIYESSYRDIRYAQSKGKHIVVYELPKLNS